MTWQALILAVPVLLVQLAGPLASADLEPSVTAGSALQVAGEVQHSLRLSAEDLARLPRAAVHAKDHDGKDVELSGVALAEVLRLAGVPTGESDDSQRSTGQS